MREILFRGKATNRDPDYYYRTDYKNGDWVYGLLTETENYMGFAEMTNTDGVSKINVDKNTIGQYIGLIDKNGNQIFEDDIVQIKDFTHGCALNYEQPTSNWVVRWREDIARFCIDYMSMLPFDFAQSEVIGNIHDNPELLKGGAD